MTTLLEGLASKRSAAAAEYPALLKRAGRPRKDDPERLQEAMQQLGLSAADVEIDAGAIAGVHELASRYQAAIDAEAGWLKQQKQLQSDFPALREKERALRDERQRLVDRGKDVTFGLDGAKAARGHLAELRQKHGRLFGRLADDRAE